MAVRPHTCCSGACVPQGATDAARAAADIVLTQPVGGNRADAGQRATNQWDVTLCTLESIVNTRTVARCEHAACITARRPQGLSTIIEAIIVARSIFQRMQNFINYRIAATLQLLVGVGGCRGGAGVGMGAFGGPGGASRKGVVPVVVWQVGHRCAPACGRRPRTPNWVR